MKTPETPFLVDFFAELKARGIRYAVMRNSGMLPESLGGSDLDLFADGQGEVEKILIAAEDVAKTHNGLLTLKYAVEATITCWSGRNADGTWWGVHIDIFPGFMYLGIPYMNSAMAYAERVLEKDSFYRLGGLSDVASFIKEIMPNRRTKKDYYPRARAAYDANPEGVKTAMIGCYGAKGWAIVEKLLSEECSEQEIFSNSKRLVRALWWHMIVEFHWLSLARIKINNICQRYGRIFSCPSYCVAFLGTDGSGKSTLIEAVKEPIERMLHSKVHYEHLRPNLLPSLACLTGKPQKRGPTTNPHGGKVAGWLSSLIRFTYYYIDYIFGFWLKIYPILVKRPSMVVFDRYYYEYMIDPRRCAVRLPRGWAKFWSRFIPKPDLILCLGGDPEKIYGRKPETSFAEVSRQVNVLRQFCTSERRALWIDTTTSINASCDTAMEAITVRMAKRYE